MKTQEEEYVAFLQKYLGKDPDALLWTLSYVAYCHSIDDIIDGGIPKRLDDKLFILKTFETAITLYTNIFFLNHYHILYGLVKMASNTYTDSIIMEDSPVKWKQTMADVLRQSANEVILAVIEIVNDLDTRRIASIELRELAYKTHHTPVGLPC